MCCIFAQYRDLTCTFSHLILMTALECRDHAHLRWGDPGVVDAASRFEESWHLTGCSYFRSPCRKALVCQALCAALPPSRHMVEVPPGPLAIPLLCFVLLSEAPLSMVL